MNIRAPIWNPKTPRCACCSGQGALCFYSCPQCQHLALICDEVGTVFLHPNDLEIATYGGLEDPNCACTKCGRHIGDFIPATADEILAAGYAASQYE